ncbi:MAG: hypothetical protein WDO68_08490 [Gammaproteobacteria bacterium]
MIGRLGAERNRNDMPIQRQIRRSHGQRLRIDIRTDNKRRPARTRNARKHASARPDIKHSLRPPLTTQLIDNRRTKPRSRMRPVAKNGARRSNLTMLSQREPTRLQLRTR